VPERLSQYGFHQGISGYSSDPPFFTKKILKRASRLINTSYMLEVMLGKLSGRPLFISRSSVNEKPIESASPQQ
jgi:hypothetical protein